MIYSQAIGYNPFRQTSSSGHVTWAVAVFCVIEFSKAKSTPYFSYPAKGVFTLALI